MNTVKEKPQKAADLTAIRGEMENVMKTYTMMNGKKFSSIESAVEAAENAKLTTCEIDVYAENGDYLETQKIERDDDDEEFVYVSYGVFSDSEWAGGYEVTFNTAEEAAAYGKSLKGFEPDELEIHGIEQTLSMYYGNYFISSLADYT